MNLLRVLLVDDEPLALQSLQKKLSAFEDIEVVQTFTEGKSLLEQIQQLDFHVLFLDIEMRGISGMELAKVLREKGNLCHIVFVTAHRDYAIEAFEVNSIDYLLKPISNARLKTAIERVKEQLKLKTKQELNNENKKYPLTVQCFGSFNVFFKDEVIVWRTEKQRELLAYLLLHQPTPVHSDVIIEALWGEDDVQKARTKLHTTISYLRKTFFSIGYDNIIGSANKSYVLNLDQFHCDAKDLEQFMGKNVTIDEKSIVQAEQILNSYQGSYMQNNSYEWSMAKARQLHEQFLLLVQQMISYYNTSGQLAKKERLLFKLLELEPYEETYIQQLLQHFSEIGNRHAAIEAYKQFEHRLLTDLDENPSEETMKLYRALL